MDSQVPPVFLQSTTKGFRVPLSYLPSSFLPLTALVHTSPTYSQKASEETTYKPDYIMRFFQENQKPCPGVRRLLQTSNDFCFELPGSQGKNGNGNKTGHNTCFLQEGSSKKRRKEGGREGKKRL